MQTLTVEITNNNALKALHSLEEKKFIRIVDDANLDSPSLQGTQLSLKAFKNWIANAENAGVVELKDVKTKWANKRKQLQRLTK
jgi:hypothetical protein